MKLNYQKKKYNINGYINDKEKDINVSLII